ncbi:hypothetical protein [Streptomyces sp. GESEQ-35]|nr:hypothetical protein [Streptomyces sp. GESEQ-35]
MTKSPRAPVPDLLPAVGPAVAGPHDGICLAAAPAYAPGRTPSRS